MTNRRGRLSGEGGGSSDRGRFSGTGAAFIEPGSPWQNPYVESFNSRARDELFSREVFTSITEAQVLYHDWCDQYNRHHPRGALGWLSPAAFSASCWAKPGGTRR